jgi:hypothetical protein
MKPALRVLTLGSLAVALLLVTTIAQADIISYPFHESAGQEEALSNYPTGANFIGLSLSGDDLNHSYVTNRSSVGDPSSFTAGVTSATKVLRLPSVEGYDFDIFTDAVAYAPEPSSIVLLGSGLLVVAALVHRRMS